MTISGGVGPFTRSSYPGRYGYIENKCHDTLKGRIEPLIYSLMLKFNCDLEELYRNALQDKYRDKWSGRWVKLLPFIENYGHFTWFKRQRIKFKTWVAL